MDIRPATPDDVPAVLPMVRKTCELHARWDPDKYGFDGAIEERYRGWLTTRARDPRSVFLVADREGRGPVAFLVATVEHEIPIYRLKEYGFVHELWVEEDYRNEGLGRQLTMTAVERFRELGVQQVRLDTAAPNDVARKLFETCGFRPFAVQMLRVTE
jgi:ribosomal protein S18 acetylase RimI-like enzyme